MRTPRTLEPGGRPPHMAGVTEIVFDRIAVRRQQERAAQTVTQVASVLGEVADRLLDRLDDTTRRFTAALDLGGRGEVAPRLRERGIACLTCEFAPAMARRHGVVAADPELLPFGPESFDLVVANLSLHTVNDLPGALVQIRTALRPDGLLLASMPTTGNLAELRDALTEAECALTGGASPRVAPFAGLADCAGLLQRAGFQLPVVDADAVRLLYADPLALLRDLRAAGEGNALAQRDRRIPPQALFAAALARLPCEEGRAVATLRLAMLTGWSPGPGQQRPAKRGSGTTNLADALR